MTNILKTIGIKRQLLSFRTFSIRNRLIAGSILIVFLAVLIMGAFFYIQASRTNSKIISTFGTATIEEAKNLLNSSANRNAETLSRYFNSLEESMLSLKGYGQSLFANPSPFETGTFWNAEVSLFRNDKGSWDNSNTEAASVFIPAKADLSTSMVSDLNIMRHLDLVAPSILDINPDVIAVYFGGTSGYTLYYPNIDLAAIVPADFDVTGRPWYVTTAPDQNPDP